jgi:hypothetical protein
MEHQEMELFLHYIDQVKIVHYLIFDLFLLLRSMLVQIFDQHKHLDKFEQIVFDQYKYEQLHKL